MSINDAETQKQLSPEKKKQSPYEQQKLVREVIEIISKGGRGVEKRGVLSDGRVSLSTLGGHLKHVDISGSLKKFLCSDPLLECSFHDAKTDEGLPGWYVGFAAKEGSPAHLGSTAEPSKRASEDVPPGQTP